MIVNAGIKKVIFSEDYRDNVYSDIFDEAEIEYVKIERK